MSTRFRLEAPRATLGALGARRQELVLDRESLDVGQLGAIDDVDVPGVLVHANLRDEIGGSIREDNGVREKG